jgi:hypothetical protein
MFKVECLKFKVHNSNSKTSLTAVSLVDLPI